MADSAAEAKTGDLRRLAEHAISRRDYDTAEVLIGEGLGRDLNDPAFLSARLDLHLKRKQWRAAGRAYATFLEKHPQRERTTWHRLTRDYKGEAELFARQENRRKLYGNLVAILALFAAVTGFAAAGWSGVLAAFGALACSLVVIECGYRISLYRRWGIKGERQAFPPKASTAGSFSAINAAAYIYHPIRGFDLAPDTQFVRVGIADGRVVEAHRCATDANGNVGFTDTQADAGSVNVVVLGDSFTSLPGNGAVHDDLEGTEWPFYLKQHLAAAGLKNIRILNYARSGHGIVQMADTAASILETHKPDVVIFAFIMHNLTRQRYWYHSRDVGGVRRGFRTQAPGSDIPLDLCADQDLIDRRITWEWSQARLADGDSDELLKDIVHRYENIRRRTSARAVDLLSRSRLYAWDRFFFGTPFIDYDTRPSRRIGLTRISEHSYAHDTQFLDAIARIKASGAKIVLLHLPLPEEFTINKMAMLAPNDAGLLQDLMMITGEKLWTLMMKIPPEMIREKYGRTPRDNHPSAWTQNLFGMRFAQMIAKTDLRSIFEKPADHAHGERP